MFTFLKCGRCTFATKVDAELVNLQDLGIRGPYWGCQLSQMFMPQPVVFRARSSAYPRDFERHLQVLGSRLADKAKEGVRLCELICETDSSGRRTIGHQSSPVPLVLDIDL